ncbi:MAG: SH3 domain-containing protein [Saprospiraceae bacterium]
MKKLLSTIVIFLALTNFVASQNVEEFLVNSKTLNMRSGPGKEFDVILTLAMDDIVILMEKGDNGWWSVDHDGIRGFVFAQLLKKDPNKGWNKKHYDSGETPECENVDPQYNFKLDNYLKVDVGTNTDVVIKLMQQQAGKDICIRIIFIRSNETYYIRNVPEGEYYLKIAYGNDWRQKIVDQQCYGKFMKNSQYDLGIEKLDFRVIHSYEKDQIPYYELYLDAIVKKGEKSTFKSNNISEAEFNK